MLNYINSFSLSTSEDKSKVVIHFGQNYPASFSEDDDTIQNELITSVILDADTAIALCSSIANNIDDKSDNDDEKEVG